KIKEEENIILQYNKLIKLLEKNVKEGKIDEVENISKKILEIFPKDVIAKFYLANIYYTHNRNEDAVKLYQEVILSQPDNLNARYNLALALIKLQQYSQAEKQLEYILSKEPNNQIIKQQIQQLKEFNNF
ncbi:MAG: tetratricopeptide repeat protein, partial [Endomicrobiia bacterium]